MAFTERAIDNKKQEVRTDMKTYNNLFTGMLEPENVKRCFKVASKGKRSRSDVRRVMENLDSEVDKLIRILKNDTFHFRSFTTSVINSASERKERLIAKPKFRYDQVVHHILMSVFSPIVTRGLYEHVYGSIPGRGPHLGKKRLERWIRSYGNRRFYVFKSDIRHFYDSIDHDLLKERLRRVINDERYLKLLFTLIDSYSPGLPKGFYTSQWLANFFLKDFDHYVKQELGARHYIRYMDDMVVLCPNKRELWKIRDGMEEYLRERLRLELKPNWAIYRFVDKNDENGRDIDFMGFRFFRKKTTLRKSNLKRIRRKALRLSKKRKRYTRGEGTGVTVHDAQSMLSYLGWTKHADVYGYFRHWIKPEVSPRRLRKKVSGHQRRENNMARMSAARERAEANSKDQS